MRKELHQCDGGKGRTRTQNPHFLSLALSHPESQAQGAGAGEGNADVGEMEEGARVAARNLIPLTEEVKWSA